VGGARARREGLTETPEAAEGDFVAHAERPEARRRVTWQKKKPAWLFVRGCQESRRAKARLY